MFYFPIIVLKIINTHSWKQMANKTKFLRTNNSVWLSVCLSNLFDAYNSHNILNPYLSSHYNVLLNITSRNLRQTTKHKRFSWLI